MKLSKIILAVPVAESIILRAHEGGETGAAAGPHVSNPSHLLWLEGQEKLYRGLEMAGGVEGHAGSLGSIPGM